MLTHRPRRTCTLIVTLGGVALVAQSASAAPCTTSVPLSNGLQVSVRAREIAPGEVVRLDVTAPALRKVEVKSPWHVVVPYEVGQHTWRALVGVDLDVHPGTYELDIRGRALSEDVIEYCESIVVREKKFPTRTLTVAPKFVTPPPSEAARIERERAELGRLFRAATPNPDWQAPFTLPIEGSVVSGFGVRSVFNNEPRAPHGGADFASPAGTPVLAPGGGRVVLVGDLYFTGNTVVIDHGVGLQSLFAHLSRADVHEGDVIKRGDVLGAVGATGRATGPHLHWTVRLNGARVDPLSLIYALEE
jgi:murein DD-endopeptidase MepM/ murein hydrolase activator NlpD